ncbi:hypothetical protein [Halorussus litoreus]|uniref:hypothetical protein n=1 Tax=Halorussus litoreus TaxID=1710536 RepID=UPI000E25E681|nr:hypothetical protein [Halorussus litoreus]
MTRDDAVPEGAQTSGHVVEQVVEGLDGLPSDDAARGLDILADHGIETPRREVWYPLSAWIEALEDIGAALGDDALTHVGRSVPEGVEWPPDPDSAKSGFATVDDAYQLNHRGGDVGYYEFVEVGEREQRVVCANPYPCSFDEGIIEGTLRAFGYEFTYPPMAFVSETGEECRAESGSQCEYRVAY